MVNSPLASATERHRRSASKTTSSNPVLERYKDSLKKTLGILGACCHSDHSRWATLAAHQDTCGHTIQQAVYSFEDTRKANITEKRRRGKDRDAAAPNLDATFICSRCSRACQSRIELTSHVRACSRGGKEKERRGEGTRRGERTRSGKKEEDLLSTLGKDREGQRILGPYIQPERVRSRAQLRSRAMHGRITLGVIRADLDSST